MAETTAPTVPAPSTPPEANRAALFWRFWTASTVSNVGDAVTAVALPLLAVRTLHASPFEVGLITAASYAAWLLIGLPAGVIAQRLPLRGTQVALDLLRALAVLSVPAAALLGILHLAQLVVVALIVGLAGVVFDVSNSSFLPSIATKEELTARNSLTSASSAATQLGGPSLGGVLVQLLGAPAGLLVDAVSYLASAMLLRSLPRSAAPAAPVDRRPPVHEQIRDGWRFVVHHPVIRPCVTAATLINFAGGALMALTPVMLLRTLGAAPGLVGLLLATEGVGSLLGAALTTRLGKRLGSARAVLAASCAADLSLLLLPFTGHGWGLLVFAVGNTGFGCSVVVVSILTRTHRQTVTPRDLLPRVMATVRFISWGAVPVGALLAGALAEPLGTKGALWLPCAIGLLIPAVLWLSPVRQARELA